jgi:uncharacterized protein (DUF433 family)
MSLPPPLIEHPHVDLRAEGSPFIKGTQVPVRRLWKWHRAGVLFTTLQRRYPTIHVARLLDALSFAYDNQDLIEADLAQERAPDNEDTIPDLKTLRNRT